MTAVLSDPLVGRVIDGKYDIEARIGSGSMGTAYRARHVSLGALRAIKVMKRELAADKGLVDRFRNEARLAEGLRHPHLVAIYDFAQLEDGSWYIVSEFVEGETLAGLLKKNLRFFSRDVAGLLGQIADGLTVAHRKGIIHRDISPDNIMVTKDENGQALAKLLDFGIAKDVVGGQTSQTGSSLLLGKVGYASPEQLGLLPKGEGLDGRTDVFSLAAVAHELLTGSLPWRKDSLQSYVHDVLVRPEKVTRDAIRAVAPSAWRDVLVRGLARHREDRTKTMQALKAQMLDASRRAADETMPSNTAPGRRREGGNSHAELPVRAAASILGPDDSTRPLRVARRSRFWPWGAAVVAGLSLTALLVVAALWMRSPASPTAQGPAQAAHAVPAGAATMPIEGRTGDVPTAAPPPDLRRQPSAEPVADAGRPASGPVVQVPTPPPHRAESAPRGAPTRGAIEPLARSSEAGSSVVPRPQQASPAPAKIGNLVLNATPAAVVTLDGQPRGKTPLTLSDVVAGRHSLVLVAEDGRSFQEELQVAPGATLERHHRFAGFGSLSVTSDVWYEVSIDGGPPLQTPFHVDRLAAGRHTLRASRSGYKEKLSGVEIKEDEAQRLNIVLERE